MFSKKIVALLIIGLITFGCKKEPGLVTFNVYREATFTIPPSTLLELTNIVTPVISTNWEADFSAQDTRKDQIKEFYLKELKLVITNPAGKTFRFMRDIRIYINADGLEETEIANKLNISDNIGQELDLDVIRVNINPYIQKDNFTLRAKTTLDEANADNVTMRSEMTYEVTANVLQ